MLEDGSREQVEGYDWEPAFHTDVTLEFAKRHQKAGNPWIYYCSYGPPHMPEECLQRFLDKYPLQYIRLPDWLPDKKLPGRGKGTRLDDLTAVYQMYYAQVAAIDHEIGRLMKGLQQVGADRDTILLFTSDHGDMLGEHRIFRGKCKPYRASAEVPMVVHWPKGIKPGQSTDAPVGLVDVLPSLLELAGLKDKTPDTVQGVSFADWCTTGKGVRQEAQYYECGYGDWRAVYTDRHVYCPSWKILFDHREDPHEKRNLIEDAKLRKQMHDLLIATAIRTKDPKLDACSSYRTAGTSATPTRRARCGANPRAAGTSGRRSGPSPTS